MTERLVGTSYVPAISLSSSVDVLAQITDICNSLSSDISQIMTAWNQEVYTTIGTLPQGASDTRWNLNDTINPKVNNLDGANIFVDTNASETADGGRYWDLARQRPTTIKESFTSIYTQLSDSIDGLRGEVNQVGSSGLTAAQIARIGDNIFDASATSLSSSLDGLTQSNNLHAVQLAKDLYDQTAWSWNSDGSPLLSNYSVRDMVDALLAIHGGAWDSSITVSHTGVGGGGTGTGINYSFITGGTGEETTSTSDVVVGGFTFDPGEYGAGIGDIEVYFEGALNYIAAGAAGTGSLRLYDMGAPGSTGAGTLRSTLSRSHTDGNLLDRVRLQLTLTSSPGTDLDEIANSVRVYELRILTDGAGAPTDTMKMAWGGLVIQPV